MRIVVVGGGKVGGYLARELRSLGHGVIVVERDAERAEKLGEETDALVVVGDGCDVSLLEEVGMDRAQFLVAVTGRDEDNLVACQLARTAFGCRRVIARLNDPRNRPTFEALEVPVVAVTDLIVQVISRELDVAELVRVALLGRGEISLLEVEIPAEAPRRRVSSIALPPSSVLVAIRRDGKVVVPGADSELAPGDRVLAVTLVELEDELRDSLLGRRVGVELEAEGSPLTIEDADHG
jgi:trk system potassium uptake protein TrkA